MVMKDLSLYFSVLALYGLHNRIILVSHNELGSLPFSSDFWKRLHLISANSSLNIWWTLWWNFLGLEVSFFRSFYIRNSVSLIHTGTFKVSTSCWGDYELLCFTQKSSTPQKLSSVYVCVDLFIAFPYYRFDICKVWVIFAVSFLIFIMCALPFFFINFARGLSAILIFSKSQLFLSLIFLYWFTVFSFTDFCSYLYYFIPYLLWVDSTIPFLSCYGGSLHL